jgi:hypothetical protein
MIVRRIEPVSGPILLTIMETGSGRTAPGNRLMETG